MKFISKILKALKPKTIQDYQNEYLSDSADLADLERRLKKVQNSNLSGWI